MLNRRMSDTCNWTWTHPRFSDSTPACRSRRRFNGGPVIIHPARPYEYGIIVGINRMLHHQNTASGLMADPAPLGTRSGAMTKRNS